MTGQISSLSLDEYQNKALETAVYPGQGTFFGLLYCATKLCGEAGEFSENVGKAIRDDGILDIDDVEGYNAVAFAQPMLEERRLKLAKELGGALWYAANAARELGYSLSEVAQMNVDKLQARAAAGTIKGDGDNR